MTTTTAVPEAAAEKPVSDEPRMPRPLRVCFSFAAYGKAVISHLRASGVPVVAGLSDVEFADVESAYGFNFPPDLRSILREGLPIGPGFPNWRSASPQQLRLLLGLPTAGLLREITAVGFWPRAWGQRPRDDEIGAIAKATLRRAPPLVPVYRHFYVPAAPSLAGNPVFYVRGSDVRPEGLDLADFFRREQPRAWTAGAPVPAWAATSARRVQVWTELAEEPALEDRDRGGSVWEVRVEQLLEKVRRRLRDGGWSEEEIAEMVTEEPESDGGDRAWAWASTAATSVVLRNRWDVVRQMQLLSLALLRGGWSADDVAESMGVDARGGRGRSVGDVASGWTPHKETTK